MSTIDTTISVTDMKATITTTNYGTNVLMRQGELHEHLWQWHEAVAQVIGDHHAQVMGHFFPCPIPEPQMPLEDVAEPFGCILPPPSLAEPPEGAGSASPSPGTTCLACGAQASTTYEGLPTCQPCKDILDLPAPVTVSLTMERALEIFGGQLPEGFSPVSHM